jgi:hypothetical protein
MFSRKHTASVVRPPRDVIKQGFWVLRTTDPANPSGTVIDPSSGIIYQSLDTATPKGWQEAFRGEYIPGAQRIKNRRAHVEIFPHEVVVVDPSRRTVVVDGYGKPSAGSISAGTCIPVWVAPA